MQTATNNKASLAETKVAIVKMYQNGTTAKLSPQAQNAAHALAQYIHANKTKKKFAFVLGKDHQDQQLLLLTIANHPVKPQAKTSLQRAIRQVTTFTQKQEDPFLVKQLSWVTKALHKVEFGILFWIYQHRLSSQEALLGTTQVPAPITAVNFQRVKTAHEQLQDQAWAKMIEVIHNLTSRQLKIQGNAQQSPSQTKIDTSHIALAIQKIITSDDEISKAASKLIKEDNIEVQPVDKTGAIIITIKNYGNDKMITIFGFKVTATPLEVAQAKIDAAQAGATLPTKSNEVPYDKTPTALDVNAPTKNGVTFRFKSATVVNNKGESRLTYEVDVNPQVKGITLKDVTFIVSGFETQAQAVERISAQAKINAAQNKIGVTPPTRLNQVLHGQIPTATDVNAPLKDGLTFKFQLATTINDRGESTLTYEVDVIPQVEGTTPQDVTFVVSGFETKGQKDERARIARLAQVAIQKLIVTNFTTGINKAQIAWIGKPLKADVISDIKKQINDRAAQVLILPGDIAITSDNAAQSITIVIHNHGPKKTITIAGFSSIEDYLKSHSIKNYLDQVLRAIPPSSGALEIPEGITNTQFDVYVQAMGNVLNEKGKVVMNKFAEQYRAKITSLTIPNSFTMIGNWFQDFDKITSLTLGDQLQTIGDYAFQSAQLTSLHIPNSVTTIGNYAFYKAHLTTLSLGNQLKTIGDSAFYNAQLTSLIIPNSVTAIAQDAFKLSPLTTLSLGNQLKTIAPNAFLSALLTSLIIPDSVIAIGYRAFWSSLLKNVTIIDDVKFYRGSPFKSTVIIKHIPRPKD